MKKISRRSFLKTSALTAGALSWPAYSWAQVSSANEAIRVAVVGFKGRGGDHIGGFGKTPGVRVVALCDCDANVLGAAANKLNQKGGAVQTYTDVRKVLESKEVDVISTATPNHWHSLIVIWACQAGKDVYVEKPVSHNVWEGRKAVEAARKYQRIVQCGTQSRSSPSLHQALAWLHEGHLGKIKVVYGLCYKPRGSIGKVSAPTPIPPSIDYDLWCGPAPMEPLMRKNLHYDWHWVWPTGNGDLGNQGIHQMDLARWFMKQDALSPRVFSVGGRLGYIDDGTTPNTQIVFHDYPGAPLIFEVRGLKTGDYRGAKIGVIIQCENGQMVIPSYTAATAYDKNGQELQKWSGGGDHYANFIKAVRSRKKEDLNADILEGHLSSALCHTGNVSYQLGKVAEPGVIQEAVKSNSDLQDSYGRFAEHLAANGVNLEQSSPTLGVFLTMDPKTERFIGNEQANTRLTRNYRKPFVVPEKV